MTVTIRHVPSDVYAGCARGPRLGTMLAVPQTTKAADQVADRVEVTDPEAVDG
jgi:hypothetical protein